MEPRHLYLPNVLQVIVFMIMIGLRANRLGRWLSNSHPQQNPPVNPAGVELIASNSGALEWMLELLFLVVSSALLLTWGLHFGAIVRENGQLIQLRLCLQLGFLGWLACLVFQVVFLQHWAVGFFPLNLEVCRLKQKKVENVTWRQGPWEIWRKL